MELRKRLYPTLERALIALRAWSHWHHVVSENPKYLPGRSLLEKGFEVAYNSLISESRKTVIRLARLSKCVFCDEMVTAGSGDHIVPKSKGGPQSAENFMPLCRRCNSSKGDKDLLEWWNIKGKNIEDLNHDALTIYLRLKYRLASQQEREEPAPIYIRQALIQAEETLPSELLNLWRLRLASFNNAL